MSVPNDRRYDLQTHLSLSDIALDDNKRPTLRVTIKQSKTDPIRQGVDIYVGHTATDLCLVSALLDYLQARGSVPGPLFMFADGRLLTRQRFMDRKQDGMEKGTVIILAPAKQRHPKELRTVS